MMAIRKTQTTPETESRTILVDPIQYEFWKRPEAATKESGEPEPVHAVGFAFAMAAEKAVQELRLAASMK